MLSIAATAPLSFAGPSAVASLGRANGIRMVETPPVFSEVDEGVRGYYRTPSESTESFNPEYFVQTLPGITAPLGFPVAEQFHPLFGGNIDAPSFSAFQQTPLQ